MFSLPFLPLAFFTCEIALIAFGATCGFCPICACRPRVFHLPLVMLRFCLDTAPPLQKGCDLHSSDCPFVFISHTLPRLDVSVRIFFPAFVQVCLSMRPPFHSYLYPIDLVSIWHSALLHSCCVSYARFLACQSVDLCFCPRLPLFSPSVPSLSFCHTLFLPLRRCRLLANIPWDPLICFKVKATRHITYVRLSTEMTCTLLLTLVLASLERLSALFNLSILFTLSLHLHPHPPARPDLCVVLTYTPPSHYSHRCSQQLYFNYLSLTSRVHCSVLQTSINLYRGPYTYHFIVQLRLTEGPSEPPFVGLVSKCNMPHIHSMVPSMRPTFN